LIINLQRIGEHPYCGIEEKLEQISGFTYVPEDFIMEGIDCKVFGWINVSNPSAFDFVLKIIKEMEYYIKIKNKKVIII